MQHQPGWLQEGLEDPLIYSHEGRLVLAVGWDLSWVVLPAA